MVKKALITFLEKENLQSTKIAVALSGGADSIALCYALTQVATSYDITVSAIHVNYHLRSDDSVQDEQFVKAFCKTHGIKLDIFQEDLSQQGSGIEEKARDKRYGHFLNQIASGQCNFVATAHTQNDQAETLLFRLTRGTGLSGLQGMEGVRKDHILRPLLAVGRDDILAYLQENNLSWREDVTNRDVHYARNRIRHAVLSELTMINKEAVAHIASFAEKARRENSKSKSSLLARFCHRADNHLIVRRDAGLSSSEAYEILQVLGLRISDVICESLAENSCQTGNQTLLSEGWSMFTLKEKLLFCKGEIHTANMVIAQSNRYTIFGGLWEFWVEIDSDSSHLPLHVRRVNEHDMLKGEAGHSAKTVIERLKKNGYSAWEREHFPLVCTEEGIPCWVPSLGFVNGGDALGLKIEWLR